MIQYYVKPMSCDGDFWWSVKKRGEGTVRNFSLECEAEELADRMNCVTKEDKKEAVR